MAGAKVFAHNQAIFWWREFFIGQIFSGNGVHYIHEFIIFIFVTCVNVYEKDREKKSVCQKLFRYIRQFNVRYRHVCPVDPPHAE